jgi:hypothetical protein
VAKDIDRRTHILVTTPGATEPYTSPQQGGGEPRLPPVHRGAHGESLRRQLEAARRELGSRDAGHDAVAVEARRGIYLEFASAPRFDIALRSLENRKAGIELVATRSEAEVAYATVYVPNGRLGFFEKRIDAYLTQETPKHQPKHKKLVESIAEIRLAVLEGFWTDAADVFPAPGQTIWWEVWLRNDEREAAADGDPIARFASRATDVGLRVDERHLRFPDRIVVLAYGTREQMTASIELLDVIAELRLAKEVPNTFLEMDPWERSDWVRSVVSRVSGPPAEAPAVCLLDTGVNAGHPLLAPAAASTDMHAYNPAWGVHDDHGHGTEMAGIALYGDLTEVLQGSAPIGLTHRIESVKILRKDVANPRDLYGAITAESVARAEIAAPHRRRAISMAVATAEGRDRGQPSSWSAEIDSLASGVDDDARRLFLICAGNVVTGAGLQFRDRNEAEGIHDPGQSWNALTVGAYTERSQIAEPAFAGWRPVARPGELAPCSTTSCTWQAQWPLKPDIVFEGGNMALSPDGTKADVADSLSLLTTHYQPHLKPLVTTGETSAATAGAARIAARIWSQYPGYWPETVRALMVHAAEWTAPMRAELDRTRTVLERQVPLRCFGFGVPNVERALWSAGNALTLVVQDELRPFDRDKSNEMQLHGLPWPAQALLDLGDVGVELRVTLSYFVEPNPARRGWERRHRYASHGLRFAMQKPTESVDEFRRRVNKAARDVPDEEIESGDAGWVLGPSLRDKGSLHHDRWTGTAIDLASRASIAVYPVIGWWRERHQLGRWKRSARYSLVVSIRTPETGVEIYQAVANQIAGATPIEN